MNNRTEAGLENEPDPSRRFPVAQQARDTSLSIFEANSNRTNDDEIDLRALWRIVLRYRKLIGLIFSIVVFTALLITLLMRPMYTATVSLEINTSGRSLVKFQNLENQGTESQDYIATQAKILESAAVANKVVEDLNLVERPEFNGKLNQRGLFNGLRSISNLFRSNSSPSEIEQTRFAVKKYQERVSVIPVRKTNLVRIGISSFDPVLAAALADQHAKAYIQLNDERRFSSTSGAKAFLEKEISNIQAKLETSEKQLNDFARKYGVVDLEDKNNIMMSRLSDLNSGLSIVQNERIDAETRLLQSKSADPEHLAAVFDDVLIKSLREELAKVKAEYFELSKIYKPAYPTMQQLNAKIDEVQANIQSQVNNIIGGFESDYQQLKLREALLVSELDDLKDSLLDLKDRAVTYNILKREWEANKSLYAGLLDRTKEVGVAAGMELNVGSVVDQASLPQEASSPKLLFNLALACGLGLIVSLGAAFLLSILDNTVHDVEHLRQITQLGHLGVTPEIQVDETEIEGDSQTPLYDTITHQKPGSIFSESIQSVRTSLSYARPGGFPKSMMVTSSVAGEGKSTVAMNLAISWAKSGQRVMVLEADFRKSRYHKIFGVPASPGLSDLLVGNTEAQAISVAEIPNLHLFVAGGQSPNPADLLRSTQMSDLIKNYEAEYDLVIVDCPPVLGLADAIVVSKLVSAVIFVVAAHQTPHDAIGNSIARLRAVGAPLIGTVLNKANSRNYGYDYYNYQYALEDDMV